MTNVNSRIMSAALSGNDFDRLSAFIRAECGIKLSEQKRIMLEARLRKRLRALGIESFGEYCDFLFSPEGLEQEKLHMIDVVTTNKTDFFREPKHFDYLTQHAIPELFRIHGAGMRQGLSIWSAGCSTGEEPYTLAMVLTEYAQSQPGFRFSILATDISTRVLEKAFRAVYKEERVGLMPASMKKKFLMRSKERERGLVRVVPELRSCVEFKRLNFMDSNFDIDSSFDIIFCRNVIIYFDRPTQQKVLQTIYRHLKPGGYLFMGHSETLSSLSIPLASVGSMVYRKPL
ncbi:MAG: protein-glutamate O-methyltransferase [Nitrospiraceae bacterium]|nr:protein-glutamate O-methyltransferase [Nitrospiraceae bacterium]